MSSALWSFVIKNYKKESKCTFKTTHLKNSVVYKKNEWTKTVGENSICCKVKYSIWILTKILKLGDDP